MSEQTAAALTLPPVPRQTGTAMAVTTDTVTMLEERLVWTAAQKQNSATTASGASEDATGAIRSEIQLVRPMEPMVMAEPTASVPAHMIRLPHGTPLDMASPKGSRGLPSGAISERATAPSSGG